MPPKKATAAASRPTRVAKTAAAAAKTTVKAPAKATTKAPTEPAAAPARKATKRKAQEEIEDEPKVNGVKRAKSHSVTPAPAPTKRKTEAPARRSPAPKKPRKRVAINEAPTEKLNVYVFGEGSSGELGLGSAKGQIEVKRPRLNPILDADSVGVVTLSVGGMHTAALTHDNKILTWGVNDQGALGRDTNWDGGLRDMDDGGSDDDSESGSDTAVNPKESTPGEVDVSELPEDTVFTQVACTDSATFALTDEGLVYGWGTFRSNEGIFGFSPSALIQTRPKLIEGVQKITALSAGANHVLALANNGAVFAWGSGQQNQLGRSSCST